MDYNVAPNSRSQTAFNENPKTLSSESIISDSTNVPKVQSHLKSSLSTIECGASDGEPKKKGTVKTLFHLTPLRSCHSSVCTPLPLDSAKRLCNYPLPSNYAQRLCNRGPAILPFTPLFHPILLDECAAFDGALFARLAPLFDSTIFDDSFLCALHPHVRLGFVLRALHPCSTQLPRGFFLARIAPVFDPAPHGVLSYAPCTPPRLNFVLRALHLCSTQLPMILSCAPYTLPRPNSLLRALHPSLH
jgi:hypothetical protein